MSEGLEDAVRGTAGADTAQIASRLRFHKPGTLEDAMGIGVVDSVLGSGGPGGAGTGSVGRQVAAVVELPLGESLSVRKVEDESIVPLVEGIRIVDEAAVAP